MRLILLFYNLCFPVALLLLLPGYLLRMVRRGNYRNKFGQRFARYSEDVRARLCASDRNTWIHAVSVGEVLIALKLIDRMRQADPALRVVLSTTTSTGFALANGSARDWLEVIYSPLDAGFIVRRALDLIRPRRLILVEAEVWPNLVAAARRRNIPVSLVNARLSPRSERRFKRFRALTGPVFRMLSRICVQEPGDIARWQSLGVPVERLHYTGSIKFDHADRTGAVRDAEFASMLRGLGVAADAPVLLAGSTFEGEELLLAEIHRELRAEFPGLFLVLVPRHVERTPGILEALRPLGLKIALRTELGSGAVREADILIVNTTGELRDWYYQGTVVFIGKSLCATGGQNPVEAVVAGKPVLFGPHMENFEAIVQLLLAREAAIEVPDATELRLQIERLLRDRRARESMSLRAQDVLTPHRGATERTVRIITED